MSWNWIHSTEKIAKTTTSRPDRHHQRFTAIAAFSGPMENGRGDFVSKTRKRSTISPKLQTNQLTSKHGKISGSNHPEEAQRNRRTAAHHSWWAVWIHTRTLDRTTDPPNGRIHRKYIQSQGSNRSSLDGRLKACNRVWHKGLLIKMLDAGFSISQVKLMRSFLTERKGEWTGLNREMEAILSPFLYNIYISDIPGQIQERQATHTKTARRTGDTGKMVHEMEDPTECRQQPSFLIS